MINYICKKYKKLKNIEVYMSIYHVYMIVKMPIIYDITIIGI